MKAKILITGALGLIGRHLGQSLQRQGYSVVGLDIQPGSDYHGDVKNYSTLLEAMQKCDGVVHLAAVSRVIWGEHNPDHCWHTNVTGTANVLHAALEMAQPPWVLFASSREVYGQPRQLPATEQTPLLPMNVYGRAKLKGEQLVEQARRAGLRTAVVRFSNVYGSPTDHPDRVIPAFIRAALNHGRLRIDGRANTFDFTHLHDAVTGVISMIHILNQQRTYLPPIQLVSGSPTALGELARLVLDRTGGQGEIQFAAPRSYDVSRFYGDPARAAQLLGWQPTISLCVGLTRLISDFRQYDIYEEETAKRGRSMVSR